MGAYNTVEDAVPEVCASCSAEILRSVQFHFGDWWLFSYRVGDEIRWGGNDEGRPGIGLVVADGYADVCPRCRALGDGRYEVWIRRDVIEAVLAASGRFDFAAANASYIVVSA